jgi:hypothetical protein
MCPTNPQTIDTMNLSEVTDDPAVIDTDEDAVTLSRSTYPVGDFLTVAVAGEPAAVLRLDDAALSGDGYVGEVDTEHGLFELLDTSAEGAPRRTLVSLSGDHSTPDGEGVDGERVASGTPESGDPSGATVDVVDRLSAAPTADFGSMALWEDVTVECLEFREGPGNESVGSRLEATTRTVERVVVSGSACVIDEPDSGPKLVESDRIVDVRADDRSSEEAGLPDGDAGRGRVEAGVTSGRHTRGVGGTD